MKITGNTILITGGATGIGFSLAEALVKADNEVIICGRRESRLKDAKEKLPQIHTRVCDVTDEKQREDLFNWTTAHFKSLNILINNAGIQRYIDLKKGYDELKSGGDEIAINFVATVELTALFIGHLMKRPSAAIINVSSGLGFMPMPNTPVYSATKAAIHTYSLVLRQQLKGTSVRVIEIVPPMVDTDLNKEGRDAAHIKFRGISLSEYIPTVIKGLENDSDIIFHSDGEKILTEPRGESERRLLNPSW